MRDFFKSIRFKIILCLIAMLIGIMLYVLSQNGYSAGTSRLINNIAKPFRYISSAVSENIDTKATYIINSQEYYQENQELKEEISRLRNELTDYYNVKEELAELEKFVGIKREHEDYVLSPPCKVLSYTANDPYYSFMIDKGSEDGISLNDPVVTADGLVGVIGEVSEKYCIVETILSPNLSVGVKAVGKTDSGILEGNTECAMDGLSQIVYIDKDSRIHADDSIITTGSSGLFPADYLVGKVISVEKASNGLSSCAIIKPYTDIRRLSSVMVVISFEGKGETDEY